jgi:Na+/H+ antiporter NhaD/arsenite permease-like protein
MKRFVDFFKGLTWLSLASLVVMLIGLVVFFFPTLWGFWETDYPEGSEGDLGVKAERKYKAAVVAVLAVVVVVIGLISGGTLAAVAAVAAVAIGYYIWDFMDYEPKKQPGGGGSTGQGERLAYKGTFTNMG